MSLFSSTDLKNASPESPAARPSAAIDFDSAACFANLNSVESLTMSIREMRSGLSTWYMTDGAWSNYDLLEYLLQITGPAAVSFTTWAINEVAITRFLAWKSAGLITELNAVIDVGLRNRKPDIYHQAMAAFPNLKMAHCHAKATVIISETHQLAIIGSANYTKNPRKEVGVIIWNETIARANEAWIKEVING